MRYAAIFIGGVGRRRALAESDRVSARRDAYQAVQRSQRSLERQWALYSVGLGARGGRPEEIGGFGRRALAASRGAAYRCLGRQPAADAPGTPLAATGTAAIAHGAIAAVPVAARVVPGASAAGCR